MIELNQIILADCNDIMATIPDKFFELAIVDPEFGIGIGNSARLVTDKNLPAKEWDNKPIDDNYFIELKRISQNQIIWGGNYYNLGITKHCIIWDKQQPENLSFGMFDFAWTSYSTSNKIFRHPVRNSEIKIHPTQKPVALYRWLIQNYAKTGDKIIDTHSGSGSLACACHLEKFDFLAIEKDADYHKSSYERLETLRSQGTLFD